jgi:iron complex outermembrane receptor protein
MIKALIVLSTCTLAMGAAAQPVQQITITGGRQALPLSIGGFGDAPLSQSPMSGRWIGDLELRDAGARSIADLTRLDASVSDAYNAEGYWSIVSVRGFTLDNRFNYRRDGLPINAETAIALDNKAGIEILKGTSGLQAGTSAPGGLANLVVKRPARALRSATLGWRQDGTLAAALDVSQRFGAGDAFGWRVNAAAQRLDPQTRELRGKRHLLAFAADARVGSTLIEAELEASRQSQASLPGFSLLGDTVPDAHAIDPRTNLNRQPWTRPVVLDGTTASLRITQALAPDWRATAHAMSQRLTSDDRIAFPFGCSAEQAFDRFCSDGSFDLYDYRSDDERRRSDALDLSLSGKARLGRTEHSLSAGVLFTRHESRFEGLAFNFVGTGHIDGTPPLEPDPTLGPATPPIDERSTELYLRDAVRIGERAGAWLGVRHTRLDRGWRQSFTTPWLAVTYSLGTELLAYASAGQGIESRATPNLPDYATPGAVLPAQRSRQAELGLKGRWHGDTRWSVAAFDIRRPFVRDAPPVFAVDGTQRHRGAEAEAEGRVGAWHWFASAMLLHARLPDGQRPPNVPARTVRGMLGRDVAALPGLHLQGWLTAEGDRALLPQADSPLIGGWARLDLGARYTHRAAAATLTWRAGVDNVFDRRAWKESPLQFGHVVLYPLAPRTWRLSVQADL